MYLVSGMFVQASKCLLFPLGETFSEALCEKVREFLCADLPAWAGFQVAGAGVYLGFGVGPLAANLMWDKAVDKWASRAADIASRGPLKTIKFQTDRPMGH